MKNNFNKLVLLAICLAGLQNVFGQISADSFSIFRAVINKSQALRKGKSYRIKSTTEVFDENSKPKSKITSITEIVLPEKSYYSSTGENGGVIKKIEMIQIGKKVFIKEGKEKWKIYIPEPASEEYGLGSSSGGKLIEKTTFNGQIANVYEEKSQTSYNKGGDRETTTRYWFSEGGELLKTEAAEKNTKTNEASRIVKTYEYDPKIKITSPIK